jgi:hypothetical protein
MNIRFTARTEIETWTHLIDCVVIAIYFSPMYFHLYIHGKLNIFIVLIVFFGSLYAYVIVD